VLYWRLPVEKEPHAIGAKLTSERRARWIAEWFQLATMRLTRPDAQIVSSSEENPKLCCQQTARDREQ
jgi:hypothetical protein